MIIYLSYSFWHSTESHSQDDDASMDFSVIPIALPTGTEVIRPIQRDLAQKNPLAFDDYDPNEWEEY